jgi:hypothetical protein
MSAGSRSRPLVELERRGQQRRARRRRRRLQRGLPILVLAVGAFVVGVVVATSSGPNYQALAAQYAHAWAQHDLARMYSLLDRQSREQLTEAQFASQYQSAASTATLQSLVVQHVGGPNGRYVPVTMIVRTAVFGTLHETLLVPYDSRNGIARVRFEGTVLFPGLRGGERLSRSISLPPRATLLARNGVPLAKGPNRTSPIPSVASNIVGRLAPIPKDQASHYAALGYPPKTLVGVDGLEHIFQSQLAGRPGGTLRAGARVLAQTRPGHNHQDDD